MDGLDVIFTADHVLTIQQLSSQYLLEYDRKQEMVRSVVSCRAAPATRDSSTTENDNRGISDSDDNSGIEEPESPELPWMSSVELDRVISTWLDDCCESYIDMEEGTTQKQKHVLSINLMIFFTLCDFFL